MTYEYEYEVNDRLSRTAQYDGVVSISLNDSWTGKKILETLRQTPLKRVRSDDLEVYLLIQMLFLLCVLGRDDVDI